jgi:voltage-gated potassium channel
MKERSAFRKKLYEIIFEADTKAGKAFDITLFVAILVSIVLVMFNSVESMHERYLTFFYYAEWFLTILFTIEYLLRIYVVDKPFKYIFSFYGIIDFLAVLPSYLALFLTGTGFMTIVRVFRLMRVFRVLKLARYIRAGKLLSTALRNSMGKIIVFLEVLITIVILMGSVMYLVEGPENGFDNIPKSIYWAIVTITTVGYGDIAPQTILGQTIASLLMIVGYSIIAVPTGIISSEAIKSAKSFSGNTQVCQNCLWNEHDDDALYCKKCGEKL